MDPPATLPDWKTFRDETIKAVASADKWLPEVVPCILDRELIAPGKQGLAPEVVASIVRTVAPDYFRCLIALDHGQWNRNHEIIAHLARAGFVTQIVTTNFDQLIEKALTSLGVVFQIYRSDEDFENRTDERSATGVEVFKLHGCLSDPDTIVATVEQEAVGLSPAKAKVIRQLWTGRSAVFWGYSGADLKVRQDYLQIAASAPVMHDVFWVLHSTPTWQEEPLPELRRLMELIPGKGIIHYCNLPQILTAVLEPEGEFSHLPPPTEHAEDVRLRRNAELVASIRGWARTSLQTQQSLEIFARLLERVGELMLASVCWEQLYQIDVKEEGEASLSLKAIAYTEGAALLCRLGEFGKAEQIQRMSKEWVVSVGSIDLLITSARTNAEILIRQGRFLESIQPRAFSHYISRWATRKGRIAALELALNTIDFLLTRGLVKEAENALVTLEQEARDAGLLEILSHALTLKSRLHILNYEEDAEAIKCIQEAMDIVIALGLESDVRSLRVRQTLLEGALDDSTLRELVSILDLAVDGTKPHNQLTATELVFDALDHLQLDPQKALELLASVEQYIRDDELQDIRTLRSPLDVPLPLAEDYKRDTIVKLSLHKSRAYRRLDDHESELAIIEDILPQLLQAGYESIAAELYERFAQLKKEAGCSLQELLRHFEIAACLVRQEVDYSQFLENELAGLRAELGIAKYPETYGQFLSNWLSQTSLIQDVCEQLIYRSHMEEDLPTGVSLDVGEILESRYGKTGRFTWSLMSAARICESARREGQPQVALKIAKRSLPIARQLGDSYLIGVFHNQAGLDLIDLGRSKEALEQFELAIEAAEQTGIDERLIHYLYNAGSVNAELERFEAALGYYAQLAPVVSRRQDFTAFLRLSLGAGEALKELGRHEEAKSHFENAEYCAWLVNDQDLVFQTSLELGKLYRDLGERETSIACRVVGKQWLERIGSHDEAGSYALLIANTYDRELGRALDAIPYYIESIALLERVNADLADTARERLAKCQSQTRKFQPWLYQLLIDHAGSEEAAEFLAIRLSLHLGRWLWHFELRSWAAWTERHLPPMMIGFSMLALGRSARALRERKQALEWFYLAKRLEEFLGDFEGSKQLTADADKEIKTTEALELIAGL